MSPRDVLRALETASQLRVHNAAERHRSDSSEVLESIVDTDTATIAGESHKSLSKRTPGYRPYRL
jgi:hypothetical protein